MIKQKLSLVFVLTLVGFIGMAQPNAPSWNWPTDPEEERATKEKQAYYKILMQTEKQDEALQTLNWLYTNTPKLHESIYKDGGKIIEEILDKEISEERKERLYDSLLWTFDMRVKLFNSLNAVDRKAYTAFKLFYKTPEKYALLRSIYQDLYALDTKEISNFNITPYMTLATYYYKSDPESFTATDVLDVHGKLSSVIDEKVAIGEPKDRLQKEQDKVDAFLNSLGDLISCDFIETNLVPKFNASPDNLNLAKKIFTYSLSAKCSDQPYFMKAAETLFTSEPSFTLAKALGDKYYFAKDYTNANRFYTSLKDLSQDADQRHDAFMGLASTQSKIGNKKQARAYAYEALSQKPGSSEAYNLVGNLYFLSFDDCKEGVSKVNDRAVFIAAYEMYEKAGNKSQMAAAKEQFPSIEDIFNEGMEEGQRLTIGCWINESVGLKRRP
ncbi:MAG: tetratricopeptide (TPR) repeat protein [Marinoscillum sp.]|jgi:tetratricopeptide (TPR) repeat protein